VDVAALAATAAALCRPGRGILASDESTGTLGKRLAKAGVENSEENRRAYRQLFYTAPGIEAGLSGAILFHEAVYQADGDGVGFVDGLTAKGILVGIKLDRASCRSRRVGTQPPSTARPWKRPRRASTASRSGVRPTTPPACGLPSGGVSSSSTPPRGCRRPPPLRTMRSASRGTR